MNDSSVRTEISRRQLLQGGLGMLGVLLSPVGRGKDPNHPDPLVPTEYGDVRGYLDDGIGVFKGIRYGADTRKRRFMAPASPAPWDDVLDAFEYAASCPQDRTAEAISEDCLFLNVWSPGLDSNARRPVMFYIHGGAYNHGSGSSPLYDGAHLARHHDVVVVTVNHRLNAFGYLYLQPAGGDAFRDSGNVGQLDLILALQWVRRNIAQFGGDPENVLAFGQSGGGAKIATLMAMPAAKGLFHRAASMSGQQVTASGPANASRRTRAFMEAVGIAPNDIGALRSADIDTLLRGLEAPDPVLGYGSVYFGPVLDMHWLDRHPFYPDAAPQSANMPMIIGNTHDETRAFLRDPKYYELMWDEVPDLLVPNMRVDIHPQFVVEQYRKLYPEYTPSQVFFAATTAARSWRGAIIELEERAKQAGADTFAYQLDFASPVEPQLGAPHGIDIPLVFGNLDARGSITGSGASAKAVSAMMSDAFVSFARDGRPRSNRLPEWKPFTIAKRETMVIDDPPRLENDPRGSERKLFERVPYVQPGT